MDLTFVSSDEIFAELCKRYDHLLLIASNPSFSVERAKQGEREYAVHGFGSEDTVDEYLNMLDIAYEILRERENEINKGKN